MLVVGDSVLSLSHPERAVAAPLASSCLRLSAAAHAPLLGIDLVELRHDAWCFVAAHRRPDLKPGGQPVLDAIARALGLGGPEGLRPPRGHKTARERDGTGDLVSTVSAMFGLGGLAWLSP